MSSISSTYYFPAASLAQSNYGPWGNRIEGTSEQFKNTTTSMGKAAAVIGTAYGLAHLTQPNKNPIANGARAALQGTGTLIAKGIQMIPLRDSAQKLLGNAANVVKTAPPIVKVAAAVGAGLILLDGAYKAGQIDQTYQQRGRIIKTHAGAKAIN